MSKPLHPVLRPVDVRRIAHNGAPYFLLRDPLKIGDHELYIPQHFGPALALFDGSLPLESIAETVRAHYGLPVRQSHLQEVAEALDAAYMLDNERFHTRYAEVLAAYRSAPNRPPALAGSSYPSERNALWQLFQDYLEEADGVQSAPVDWTQGVGLLSPHIDYDRGSHVYAQVWKRAAQAVAEADLAVIFGTDHYGDDLFTLTRQNYATPYGTLPTDLRVVDALAATLGEEAAFAGELRHRGEHSLELVAVWLHHIREAHAAIPNGNKQGPLPVVPILVGSLHEHIANGSAPQDDPRLAGVLGALKQATANRRVLYVASGDLAHVGPAFGGAPLHAEEVNALRAADAALLRPMQMGNAAGFFAEIKRVQNSNNVCGVTPLYLTLRALGDVHGTPSGYAHYPADEAGLSLVSVAGMLFQGNGKHGA
jgi:AmmeMemoRadiSam system protein B